LGSGAAAKLSNEQRDWGRCFSRPKAADPTVSPLGAEEDYLVGSTEREREMDILFSK